MPENRIIGNIPVDTTNSIGKSVPLKDEEGNIIGTATCVDADGNFEMVIDDDDMWERIRERYDGYSIRNSIS